MDGYSVEIKETLTRIVRVENASSKEDAERIVKARYDNQEIILDAEDLKSVDIEAHKDKFLVRTRESIIEEVMDDLSIYDALLGNR